VTEVTGKGPAADSPLVGIALLLAAVACFSGLDASAKWLSRGMEPVQVAAMRYLGAFLLFGALMRPWRRPGLLRSRRPWLQVGRALCLVGATVAAFYAFRALSLTEVTSVTFAAPLIVSLLAGPLLGERLGPHRLGAVLVGFLGVLVVTRPGTAAFHPAVLLALLAALCNALYALSTRVLAAHDRAETTMLLSLAVGAAVSLPVLPFIWTTPAGGREWLVLGAVIGFGTLGHWLLILAHARARASVLAPFFYAQLIGAAAFGYALFGTVPDRWTVLGAAIVAASGLYLFWREGRARRRGATA